MIIKNFKFIKYSLKHWVALNKLAMQKKVWHWRFLLHDLDKVFLYCFIFKEKASAWHKDHSKHHVRNNTVYDPLQAVLDWECARFTKPDKPLTARETWKKYYSDVKNVEPYIRLIER